MPQYFDPQPGLASKKTKVTVKVKGRLFSFETDSGVFCREGLDFGSRCMLQEAIKMEAEKVLDLGCGWGPVGLIYQAFHPQAQVDFTDISARAVALAEANSRGQAGQFRFFVADSVPEDVGPYDLILLNPPIRAGKACCFRLYEDAVKVLDGTLLVVIQTKQGAKSSKKALEALGPVEVLSKEKGYHVFALRKEAGCASL